MPRSVQIVPYYAQPHVHTVINDNSFYSEDVAVAGPPDEKPYNTMIVTGADKGIDNKFVKLTDYGTKVEIFGKGNYAKYGQSSIQADVLLQNNQTNVWYMRVLPSNARYANMALIAHYRKPQCVTPGFTGDPDSSDCEVMEQGGTAENPIMIPTGLKQLEVKFSTINVTSKLAGASHPLNDSDIEEYLNGKVPGGAYTLPRGPIYTTEEAALYGRTPADLQGFQSVPILYVRSTGRGRYGNKYAIRLQRDVEFEYDYDIKAYGFGVIERDIVTKAKHYFVGTMAASGRYDTSMLIDDVIGAYSTGSAPIFIKTYETALMEIYDAYRSVVGYNAGVIASTYMGDQVKLDNLAYALGIVTSTSELNYDKIDTFDPIFGYRLNDKENLIPYYASFTTKQSGPYVQPDVELMNYLPQTLTTGDPAWASYLDAASENVLVQEGTRVLVKNYLGTGSTVPTPGDGANNLHRLFVVKSVTIDNTDSVTNTITDITVTYDEGTWVGLQDHLYTGTNLNVDVGCGFAGGYDGEFEEITAHAKNGVTWTGSEITRAPNQAEMKLLLSREYVMALRGEKDRFILSPARIKLDFIFDANYNICADVDTNALGLALATRSMFANSQVLTNEEYKQLSILDTGYQFNVGNTGGLTTLADILNVKKALYDLNNYRNKNGMSISNEEGAGCELKLDCGLIGLSRTSEVSNELRDLLTVMSQFAGRNTSVDFGHYEIIDPVSKKKVPVTVGYFLSEALIPHIIRFGPNKPFVNSFARVANKVRNSFKPELDLIDWDVKELLYTSRINYYVTMDEGLVVQRTTQNTCQKDASALLEENNVRVLNILKKGLERACRNYLYEWNDPVVRKGYTDAQMEIYKPWIGTWVEDLQIRFEANAYEEERMMMHCYVDIKFRNIVKRIIIEIDISKPIQGGGQ